MNGITRCPKSLKISDLLGHLYPASVSMLVTSALLVDHKPRLLNVGPKPMKWAGDSPFSAFKTILILHYRTNKLHRQKWGIPNLAFPDNACRTTFLSCLTAERGIQTDPKLIALEYITWEDFSGIMTDIYGHQVTDHDIRSEIEALTRLNSLGPDTVALL